MIEIYTDGACSGNPGPGGWGVLLRIGQAETELCGGEPATTNNRMELLAVIEALQSFTQPVTARVYTDSQYVQKGISEWLEGWKATGPRVRPHRQRKDRNCRGRQKAEREGKRGFPQQDASLEPRSVVKPGNPTAADPGSTRDHAALPTSQFTGQAANV